MKGSCPLKTSPQWLGLRSVIGDNNTWKVWMASKTDDLPEPVAAAFYLYVSEKPEIAAALLEKYIPLGKRQKFNISTTVLELIDNAQDAIFQEDAFKQWLSKKGYLDKIFAGEKIKRTPEVEEAVAIKEQTLAELVAEVPDTEAVESIYPVALQNQIRANEIMFKYAQMLGQDYKIISKEEADLMLNKTTAPYKGQAVFWLNKTMHYVQDKITPNTPFYEMAYPVLKILEQTNPDLYNNTFNKLMETPEGQLIAETLNSRYPLLQNQNSSLYKEKVFMEALKKDAIIKRQELTDDPIEQAFQDNMKNLMSYMRQLLRKRFTEKIKAEKINTTTNLFDLADLLTNKQFDIEAEKLSNEDINNYESAIEKAHNDVINHVRTREQQLGINQIIDDMIIASDRQIRQVKGTGLEDIRKVLDDEEAGGYLRDIKETFNHFKKNKENLKDYANISLSFRAKALIKSLFTLEKALIEINSVMSKLEKSSEDPIEKLARVQGYYNLINEWSAFIKSSRENILKSGIPRESNIFRFVSTLDALINEGTNLYRNIQEDGAITASTKYLQNRASNMRAEIEADIKNIESKSGDTKIKERKLKALREKLEKYTFTKDKVRDLYEGKLGDANFFSTMFESYTTNPDPVLAPYALYLKENADRITQNSFMKIKKFKEELRAPMEALGMTSITDERKKWGEYLVVDTKPVIDKETGELAERDVVTLLSPLKNYRFKKARLEQNIEDAKKEGDQAKIDKAYKDLEEEESKYWNRQYVKKYYQDEAILKNTNRKAYEALNDINTKIKEFKNTYAGEIEFFENNNIFKALEAEKARLYSEYDEAGVLKDAEGVKMAQDLMAHRERMSKYYTSTEKVGDFNKSFEAFAELVKEDPKYAHVVFYNTDGTLSDEYKKILLEWLNQNTQKKYEDEYYIELNDIFKKLEELSKDLPERYRVDKLYKKRTKLLTGFKDSNGQTDPSLMKENRAALMAELKATQLEINRVQAEAKAFMKADMALSIKMGKVFLQLNRLRFTEPTEYYLQELNTYLASMNETEITLKNAEDFLNDIDYIDSLKGKSKAFKAWFEANHIEKEMMSADASSITLVYERLNAWSIAKPKEQIGGKSFIKRTRVIYNNEVFNIEGIPSKQYFRTQIKEQYKTIKDNMTEEEKLQFQDNKGRYLPLTKEQGAPVDSPYINEAYYNLIKDSNKAKVLKALTKYHLANQKKIDPKQKLYLDYPRFPISDTLEGVQTGEIKDRYVGQVKAVGAGFLGFITGKSKDEINAATTQTGDVERGLANAKMEENEEQLSLMSDFFMNPSMEKVPMQGLSNIPTDKITYDVIASLNLYGMQAEKQRIFNEISPVVNATLNTLENLDAGTQQIDDIRRKAGLNVETIKGMMGKTKDKSVRAAGLRDLTEREFKGKIFSENHLEWVNKLTSAMTSFASLNYFALNIPSLVKNYWGMLWQMNIEGIVGEYFDGASMAKGKLRAFTAMGEWTTRIWGGNYNTVDTQLILFMDAIQGKALESLGRDSSRSFAKDVASLSFVYSPRKFVEMEGGLQIFYSMMHHKKIDRIVNGVETKISYADAWELDKEGRLVLKAGVDESYGIKHNDDGTVVIGENFTKFKDIVHEKFKDLNGAFAKFEQPQAGKFFAYRLFAFMRRYFTTMFMYRFGKSRANFAVDKVRTGYYVEAVKSVAEIITSLGRSIPFLRKDEKRAMVRLLADVAQILIISAIASLLFGFDDDDEDRFEKLRDKSGALGEDDFDLGGWLSNQTLTLLLKTQAENQSFIPLPNLGLSNYLDLSSTTSIAFGPTITSYAKILTDLAQHAAPGEDEDLYYTRDMGPYGWQKEGEAKIWNHISSMLGFSGSQVDPVKGLQSWDSFRR